MAKDRVCFFCGARWDELDDGRKMGCGKCYTIFAEELAEKLCLERHIHRGMDPESRGDREQEKEIPQLAETDVAVCSRVILARNVREYPFPVRMNVRMAGELADKVQCVLGEGYRFTPLGENKFFVRKEGDEEISVLLGEEDHIRIQCVLPGLALQAGWCKIGWTERKLGAMLPFAFDEQRGYLTGSWENCGTALRGSVTLLLPGLNRAGKMEEWEDMGDHQGILLLDGGAVNAYILVNKHCIGNAEEEILETTADFARRIIAAERLARQRAAAGEQEVVWRENLPRAHRMR